jgi:hypothetical protein
MKESEAKEKWCPMVRVGNDDSAADNRTCKLCLVSRGPGVGVGWNCCIGHECMFWRVDLSKTHLEGEMDGYCGLGGRP